MSCQLPNSNVMHSAGVGKTPGTLWNPETNFVYVINNFLNHKSYFMNTEQREGSRSYKEAGILGLLSAGTYISRACTVSVKISKDQAGGYCKERQREESKLMGNCMWTGFGCSQEHAGVFKVITGRGGMRMAPAQDDDDMKFRSTPASSSHRHHQEGLSKVDVTHGLDLQLAENVAPCRLSSGTAADLLSKITYSERAPTLEVLPSHQKGIWKVKLVITAEQLADILSHQSNTEALIERMSLTAAHAKCTTNIHMDAQRSSFSSSSSSPSSESCQIGCLSGGWKPSLDTISEIHGAINNPLGEKSSELSQRSVL